MAFIVKIIELFFLILLPVSLVAVKGSRRGKNPLQRLLRKRENPLYFQYSAGRGGVGKQSSIPEYPSSSPSAVETSDGSDWAFEETFDRDPSEPSQDLLPRSFDYVVTHRTHPKEHFSISFPPYPADHDGRCAGPDPNVSPLPQHYVVTSHLSNSSHPDESFYICKNHVMSSMGDVEGYSVTTFYPRQEFQFGGGDHGRTLEFEVSITSNHGGRSWWELLITPRQQLKVGAAIDWLPISETYPRDRIVFSFLQNRRSISVGTGDLSPSGWLVQESQWWDWSIFHPDDPALVDGRIRKQMRLTFENNDSITWAIETTEGGSDEWTVQLPGVFPFSQGLVVFTTHAYTPQKDGNYNAYTFHWDNIRFDGPVVGTFHVYEADNVVYLESNGNRPIGDEATVTIDVAQVGTNPVLFGQVHSPKQGQVLVSINGGANMLVEPYDYDEGTCVASGWKSFRLPLEPSQLQPGTNTVTWKVGPRPDCVESWQWDGFSVKFLQLQFDD